MVYFEKIINKILLPLSPKFSKSLNFNKFVTKSLTRTQ